MLKTPAVRLTSVERVGLNVSLPLQRGDALNKMALLAIRL